MKEKERVIGDQVFVLISQEYLFKLQTKLDEMLELLKGRNESSQGVGDYIQEKEACKLLGYKSTWFWMKRNSGALAYTKVGNKVYYKKQDIENLMEANRKEAIPESKLLKVNKIN